MPDHRICSLKGIERIINYGHNSILQIKAHLLFLSRVSVLTVILFSFGDLQSFHHLQNMSYLAGTSTQDVSREIQTVQEDIQNLSRAGDGDDQAQRQALLTSARKLVTALETTGHVVARMSWDEPTMSGSLRILIDLGIFKHMLAGDTTIPKQANELAELSGADPVLLQRLLKRVASSSPPLVEETGADEYVPNRWTRAFADEVNTGAFTDVYVESFPETLCTALR